MESPGYYYEAGYLLDKQHEDYDTHPKRDDKKYAYYNWYWGVVKRTPEELNKLKESWTKFTERNYKNTYALIAEVKSVNYDDESEWEDGYKLSEKNNFSFDKNSSNIIWEIENINGELNQRI